MKNTVLNRQAGDLWREIQWDMIPQLYVLHMGHIQNKPCRWVINESLMSTGEHFKCEPCLHILMKLELVSVVKRCMFLNHAPATEEEIWNLNRRQGGVQANQIFELAVWIFDL